MKYLIPTFGGTVVGVGGLTYGGMEAYKKLKPRTWGDILRAEGLEFITKEMKEENGKKIWSVLKQKYSDGFIDNVDKDKEYSDVKEQCDTKLKEWADRNSNEYSKTLEKIKKTCVKEGPKNTKEWIKHQIWEQGDNQKETLILRDNGQANGDDETQEFEVMFAVYRHEHEPTQGLPQFLDWLKSHAEKRALSKDSEIKEGGEELKKVCKKLFDKSKGTIAPGEHNNYRSGFMWCRKLPYTTVKEKMEKDTEFEKETQWSTLKDRWQHSEEVKKIIKDGGGSLEDNDYESFCGTSTENKKLNEKDVYQKTYLVFKSVCYKKKTVSNSG